MHVVALNRVEVATCVAAAIIPAVKFNKKEEAVGRFQAKQFEDIRHYVKGMKDGKIRALYLSGAGGMGKSWTVKQVLRDLDPEGEKKGRWIFIPGKITPGDLYDKLHNYSAPGCVVVIDDADSIIKGNITGLNLLKAATDSRKERVIAWNSTKPPGQAPSSYKFKASVCIISNTNIGALIAKAKTMGDHYEALQTRMVSVHVAIESQEHRLIRLKYVSLEGHLFDECEFDVPVELQTEVLEYMQSNMGQMKLFSMRTPGLIAAAAASHPDWKDALKRSEFFKPECRQTV
jgi:hypothetical protein